MNNTIDVQVCGNQGMFPCTYKTVVLKPNIINDKNILNQGMMNMPNTKYVIKYDFLLSDVVVTKTANIVSTNVSQCGNAAYATALANYNAAHEAWIQADNAYSNNPNDTTLAAKNAAYEALQRAQSTLTGTPQYYYFAGIAINLTKGQHISIPYGCVLLNGTLNGLADFELAPNDITVYIGSAVTGTYEYTILNGIEMPANCLIEFDGGSISNGVLVGNNTNIEASLVKIFGTDINLHGTWSILEVYPEWFGAKGNGVTDDTDSLQKALNIMPYINTSVLKLKRTYLITRTVYIGARTIIEGEPGTMYYGNPTIIANLDEQYNFALCSDVWDINLENRPAFINQIHFQQIRTKYGTNDCSFSIKNIKINSNNYTFGAIRLFNNTKSIFENIAIDGFKLGFHTVNVWNCTFNSISIQTYYIGLSIAADCTSNVFNNVETIIRTREHITPQDRTYYSAFVENINLPDGGVPSDYSEPVAWAMGFGSATMNNCCAELFNAAIIAKTEWLVCNNLYVEGCTDFIIALARGRAIINNMYGNQPVLQDKYSYVAGSTSILYLTNCHAGKCYNYASVSDYNFSTKRPVYVIKGISNYGAEIDGIVGNNYDNSVEYPEFTVVNVNDSLADNDSINLGVIPAKAISLETALQRIDYNGIYRNIDIIRLVGNCSINTANLSIRKNVIIDLNGFTLTINKSLTLYKERLHIKGGNIVLNKALLDGIYENEYTVLFLEKCNISATSNIFIVRQGSVTLAGFCNYLVINLRETTYKINNVDADKSFYYYNGSPLVQFVECKIVKEGHLYNYQSQLTDTIANIQSVAQNSKQGFTAYSTDAKKLVTFDGSKFREQDGAVLGVARSGAFANKPAAADIYVGFKYFCTDKQTTEGTTNGIEIIHKGSDVWVDALGRVVS